MGTSKQTYLAFTYGIPFGAFGIIFLFITIIHKRVEWFILQSVLGVKWGDDDISKKKDETSGNSSHPIPHEKHSTNSYPTLDNDDQTRKVSNDEETIPMSTYLYIDTDVTKIQSIPPLPCFVRLLSDFFASAILAIFVSIIFNSLILSYEHVANNKKCPTFDADCFGTIGGVSVGPFSCSDGQYTNFSVNSVTWWCAGWVYQNTGINDVIGTLGTCGGLIGIISTIVPFVYYLSYYKKCCGLSIMCIILPFIVIGGLGWTIWYTLPEGPSQLTIVVFAVLITMAFIGWIWAVWQSCVSSSPLKTLPSKYRCKPCCRRRFCSYKCKNQCCKDFCSIFVKRYDSYPWCCFIYCQEKCCPTVCCTNDCLNNGCMKCFVTGCCEDAVEENDEDLKSISSSSPVVVRQLPPSTNGPNKRAW